MGKVCLPVRPIPGPFARWFGIDGVILMAFILGFPANEIVFPLIVMSYLQSSVLVESESLTALHNLLCANGWSMWTAAAVALLCLFHWPCSTTCLTIYKETGSTKWTCCPFCFPPSSVFLCAFCSIFCTQPSHYKTISRSGKSAAADCLLLF